MTAAELTFSLQASDKIAGSESASVVDGWGRRKASLQLNGKPIVEGKEFRIGHIDRLEGSSLVIWVRVHLAEPAPFRRYQLRANSRRAGLSKCPRPHHQGKIQLARVEARTNRRHFTGNFGSNKVIHNSGCASAAEFSAEQSNQQEVALLLTLSDTPQVIDGVWQRANAKYDAVRRAHLVKVDHRSNDCPFCSDWESLAQY